MREDINYETNDRHDHLVEVRIEVPLNGGTFAFVQPIPRYIHGKITADDWQRIGIDLRTHAESTVRKLALSGAYFEPNGIERARALIIEGAQELIHREFRRRNNDAGNLEWAVPSLLKGETYK